MRLKKSTQNLISELEKINPSLSSMMKKDDPPYITEKEMLEYLKKAYPDKTDGELKDTPEYQKYIKG